MICWKRKTKTTQTKMKNMMKSGVGPVKKTTKKSTRKATRTVRRRAYRLVHLYQIDRCVLRTGSGERELWRKVTDLGYSRRPINTAKEG